MANPAPTMIFQSLHLKSVSIIKLTWPWNKKILESAKFIKYLIYFHRSGKKLQQYFKVIKMTNNTTATSDKLPVDMCNQACNHRCTVHEVLYLFRHTKQQ